MKHLLPVILFLTLTLTLAPVTPAHAVDINSTFQGINLHNVSTVGQLVSILVPNVYVGAGVIFLFMLIITGLAYIFGAGIENPQVIQATQQALLWTFVGFLIILASYWIVQIIETVTGFPILK